MTFQAKKGSLAAAKVVKTLKSQSRPRKTVIAILALLSVQRRLAINQFPSKLIHGVVFTSGF